MALEQDGTPAEGSIDASVAFTFCRLLCRLLCQHVGSDALQEGGNAGSSLSEVCQLHTAQHPQLSGVASGVTVAGPCSRYMSSGTQTLQLPGFAKH